MGSVLRHVAVLALLSFLSLLGCKDLPDIRDDTCGNAVVEPEVGEDCDLFVDPALGEGTQCGAAGTSQSCRYLCDADGSPACPTGWGCGADGVCRFPSGRFVDAASFDLGAAQSLALADFDGDATLDVMGLDAGT